MAEEKVANFEVTERKSIIGVRESKPKRSPKSALLSLITVECHLNVVEVVSSDLFILEPNVPFFYFDLLPSRD